jgi:hypothetical protein
LITLSDFPIFVIVNQFSRSEKANSRKNRASTFTFREAIGVEDWADLARRRLLTALWRVIVLVLPRGFGPGSGA